MVVAPTRRKARALLAEALRRRGLDGDEPLFTLREISVNRPAAHILSDGDY